jgi:hypothetical protein
MNSPLSVRFRCMYHSVLCLSFPCACFPLKSFTGLRIVPFAYNRYHRFTLGRHVSAGRAEFVRRTTCSVAVCEDFARVLPAVQRVAFARFLHRRATRLLTISKFVADSVAARSSYSLSVEGTLRQRMKGTSAQDSEH